MKKTHIKLSLLALLFVLIRCGTEDKKAEDNMLPPAIPTEALEPDYSLSKLNYMRLSGGQFITYSTLDKVPVTTRADLSTTFDYLTKNDSNLIVYFHGGLIPVGMAYRDPKKMKLDSAVRNAKYFPYYVLYGAGPGSIVWNFVRSPFFDREEDETIINKEEAKTNPLDSAMYVATERKSFKYLLIQLNRKFFSGDQKLMEEYTPITDTTNLDTILKREAVSFTEKISVNTFVEDEKLQDKFKKAAENDPIFQRLAEEDASEAQKMNALGPINWVKALYSIGKITYNISRRISKDRHHYTIMTLVEEILQNTLNTYITVLKGVAQKGWGQLKENTETPFLNNADKFGGTALLDELAKLEEFYRSQGKTKKIYLIGSSTGTIMLCHLLKKCNSKKYEHLKFHVIFSVPACTFDLFASAIDEAKTKIQSFHMFALRDEDEKSAGWTIPYPGTILYFVSGVCEEKNNEYHDIPIVGMQKYYTNEFYNNSSLTKKEKRDILKVKEFMKMTDGVSTNVVWSNELCPDANLSNTGKKHTKVIRNPDVLKSINYLMKL